MLLELARKYVLRVWEFFTHILDFYVGFEDFYTAWCVVEYRRVGVAFPGVAA